MACIFVLAIIWLMCGGTKIIGDAFKPKNNAEEGLRAIYKGREEFFETEQGKRALKSSREYDREHHSQH